MARNRTESALGSILGARVPLSMAGVPDKLTAAIRLDEIYSRVPAMDCKGKCQECCGPIMAGAAEWERVLDRATPAKSDALTCPILIDGRCSAYAVRPLICRLWGAVKAMRCPFGCRPKRWLSDEEAHHMIEEVLALSGGMVDGPAADMVQSLELQEGR